MIMVMIMMIDDYDGDDDKYRNKGFEFPGLFQ